MELPLLNSRSSRIKTDWDNCSAAIATSKSEETETITEEAMTAEAIEVLASCTKVTGHVPDAEIQSMNFRSNPIRADLDNCFAAIATGKKEECNKKQKQPAEMQAVFVLIAKSVL